jgi:hypothetical protein
MTQRLEGIDVGDILQHMPAEVRISVELLERAGVDWDTVGTLLAASPTAGVALTGTGQWTSDLWQAVKWEIRSFICTDSEPYAALREAWDEQMLRSPTRAIGSLATLIGTRLGVAGGVVAPMVAWLIVVSRRMKKEALCLTLSAVPAVGLALPRSPDE